MDTNAAHPLEVCAGVCSLTSSMRLFRSWPVFSYSDGGMYLHLQQPELICCEGG